MFLFFARLCGALTGLGAAVLCFYLREKLRAYTVKATILKSAVSLLFVATAFVGAFIGGDKSAPRVMAELVLFGLVCGLTGDIWLDLKFVFPQEDKLFTYAGFCAFGVGHICYIAGMLGHYYIAPSLRGWLNWPKPIDAAYIYVPLLLGTALGFGNILLEKPMKLRYGKYKAICIAYGVLLFSTVLLSGSLALWFAWRETAPNLMFAGALLFAASDLVLSGTYFGEGKDRPVDLILNYLTYYPGQFLIAWSLLYLH